MLELLQPHRRFFGASDLKEMEAAVNDADVGVEIHDLVITDRLATVRLARHSESKRKKYRCVVWSGRPIRSLEDHWVVALHAKKDIPLVQKTPLRVLHRRSLLDRPKVIHGVQLERVNDHWFVVDVETQAGTYVKEFVHGDCGRTSPSLGDLLHSCCDIVQLDVLNMVMVNIATPTEGEAALLPEDEEAKDEE